MDRFNAERIRKSVGLEDFARSWRRSAPPSTGARVTHLPVTRERARRVHFEERDGLVHYAA